MSHWITKRPPLCVNLGVNFVTLGKCRLEGSKRLADIGENKYKPLSRWSNTGAAKKLWCDTDVDKTNLENWKITLPQRRQIYGIYIRRFLFTCSAFGMVCWPQCALDKGGDTSQMNSWEKPEKFSLKPGGGGGGGRFWFYSLNYIPWTVLLYLVLYFAFCI